VGNKDWNGNKKSTFVTLGASNHTQHNREEHDYYATNVNALYSFLKSIKKDNITLSNEIYECACGGGHLSEGLISKGYKVLSTDLINRGYEKMKAEVDFLTYEFKNKWKGDILTNPPYKYSLEFVKKGLDIIDNENKVIMFLKIQFLEGKGRHEFFKKHPPKYVYVHSSRQQCALGGDFEKYKKSATAQCYCWYIWEKGYNGDTIIRWIE